jgi:2,3-bisphosphoglycerate-dependent phosphoglycerate mutase
MVYLVLVRHGISEYNKKGLWTGWDNPPLLHEGEEEAREAGVEIEDMNIHFDFGYTSILKRAIDTLEIIKETINQIDLPTIQAKELNERNYGDFTRKNKWQVKEQLGEIAFTKLRRSWDYPIPNGESLKQVYERTIPYFRGNISPKLQIGKNIIISSSGNSLRTLVKYLEQISDEKIVSLEIATGEVYIYEIDENGQIISKNI